MFSSVFQDKRKGTRGPGALEYCSVSLRIKDNVPVLDHPSPGPPPVSLASAPESYKITVKASAGAGASSEAGPE